MCLERERFCCFDDYCGLSVGCETANKARQGKGQAVFDTLLCLVCIAL